MCLPQPRLQRSAALIASLKARGQIANQPTLFCRSLPQLPHLRFEGMAGPVVTSPATTRFTVKVFLSRQSRWTALRDPLRQRFRLGHRGLTIATNTSFLGELSSIPGGGRNSILFRYQRGLKRGES